MENPFNGPVDPKDFKKSVASKNPFSGPKDPEKPKKTGPNALQKAGGFGLDVLRNFNDSATFGLYPKLLQATGIDKDAEKKISESNPWAKAVGNTAGYMLPGVGISMGVGKAVPALAKNTVASIAGNQAVTSGSISALDDVLRDGTIDPTGVAIDAGIGGLASVPFTLASRAISPSARVRHSGVDLTPEDKITAAATMQRAREAGIPLNVPEAVNAAAPTRAQGVTGLFDDAAKSPKGSKIASSFNAARKPMMEQAGRDIVDQIGPGPSPFRISEIADEAIKNKRNLVKNSAKPFYDAAGGRKLPPTWMPTDESITKATREILDDPELIGPLTREFKALNPTHNGKIPTNSVMFQDAVKKHIDEMAGAAFGQGKNKLGGNRASSAEIVRKAADRVAPEYKIARDISSQGNRAVDELAAGPLTTIANNPHGKAQASALFGPDNAADAAKAIEAAKHLGAGNNMQAPRGVLANAIDSQVSKNPVEFGKNILPNEHSRDIAKAVMGPDYSVIGPKLEAASAVRPLPGITNMDGGGNTPISSLWSSIRDYGKGGIAQISENPAMIPKLGTIGPVQKGLTLGASVAMPNASDFSGRISGNDRKSRKERIDLLRMRAASR